MKHKKDDGIDLPPKGDRNADPITGEEGSHPIETGVGAALGGAATGVAAGAAAGPVGAAVGAAVGAVVGGLAGKGVGEVIDPTEDDPYYRDTFSQKKYVAKGRDFEAYRPAYRYGATAYSQHSGRSFDEIESDLQRDWESTHAKQSGVDWAGAHGAVRDAYDRTSQRQRNLSK